MQKTQLGSSNFNEACLGRLRNQASLEQDRIPTRVEVRADGNIVDMRHTPSDFSGTERHFFYVSGTRERHHCGYLIIELHNKQLLS
jgi:hypothetical protein